MSRTPEEIVADLAPAYKEWKGGEKSKNKLKEEFFEAITTKLANEELGEDIVLVEEAESEKDGQEWVEKRHPFHEVTDARKNPDGSGFEYIIRERPEFMTFYVDYDGYTYGRQVASGSLLLDDEALKDDNEELWFEVTEFPNEDFILNLVYEAGVDPENVEDFISKIAVKHGITRHIKSLGDLDSDLLAKIQPYIYEGKPVVKLPSPKKAKE